MAIAVVVGLAVVGLVLFEQRREIANGWRVARSDVSSPVHYLYKWGIL